MNAEHLLDAIGLLDDGLLQEAEDYTVRRQRPGRGSWMALAASFAVVIALGYVLARGIGMGGDSAAPEYTSGGAAGEPSGSAGMEIPPPGEPGASNAGGESQGFVDSASPGSPMGSTGDWQFALRVDGTVYWATEEYIELEPAEGDIRRTTSFINSAEPEEDGQANFQPIGKSYVALENGTVAVLQEDTGSWQVYDPVPPWDR